MSANDERRERYAAAIGNEVIGSDEYVARVADAAMAVADEETAEAQRKARELAGKLEVAGREVVRLRVELEESSAAQ